MSPYHSSSPLHQESSQRCLLPSWPCADLKASRSHSHGPVFQHPKNNPVPLNFWVADKLQEVCFAAFLSPGKLEADPGHGPSKNSPSPGNYCFFEIQPGIPTCFCMRVLASWWHLLPFPLLSFTQDLCSSTFSWCGTGRSLPTTATQPGKISLAWWISISEIEIRKIAPSPLPGRL